MVTLLTVLTMETVPTMDAMPTAVTVVTMQKQSCMEKEHRNHISNEVINVSIFFNIIQSIPDKYSWFQGDFYVVMKIIVGMSPCHHIVTCSNNTC